MGIKESLKNRKKAVIISAITVGAIVAGSAGTMYAASTVLNKNNSTDAQVVSEEQRTGTNNTSKSYIGVQSAKEKATADAGVTDVTYTKAEIGYNEETAVYDIEFYTSSHKYDYEINALTGDVYQKNSEEVVADETQTDSSQNVVKGTESSQSSADQNTNSRDTSASTQSSTKTPIQYTTPQTSTNTATDNNSNNNSSNGSNNSNSNSSNSTNNNTSNNSNTNTNTNNNTNTSSSSEIGIEAAKSKALSHAGKSAGEVQFVKAKQDYDDGQIEYEIEFWCEGVKYEFEISATGAILDYEIDYDD